MTLLSAVCLLNAAGTLAGPSDPHATPIDTARAHRYFQEARALSESDGGNLWGIPLYGPMLFVDAGTRAVVANQRDALGQLQAANGVFVGTLPVEDNVANTAIRWSDTDWTMLVWPLPQNADDRARLLAHEMWHRIQGELGFPGSNPSNAHLDTLQGRLWLLLEWRALQAALMQREPGWRDAVKHALLFRAYRRSLFSDAASEERALEMHEGLAEYTGVKLAARGEPAAIATAVDALKEGKSRDSLIRSFAYASGPAYGLLLDRADPKWRSRLTATDDLGDLLRVSLSIALPDDLAGEALRDARPYGYEELAQRERTRERERQQRLARFRARLVDGPVLIIPLQEMNIQFNPGNLVPLDDLGTVYPTMRITDVWGILTVSNGALLNTDWTRVTLPAPGTFDANPIIGDGWQLQLNPGWKLVPAKRPGDYLLTRAQ